MVAAAVGGAALAGVASSAISSSGAKSAAQSQAASNQQGIQAQQAMYNQTRADLAPYNQAGQANLPLYQSFYQTSADQLGNAYNDAYNHLPGAMTEANLVNTPGYQFNLSQGLKATQNSAAARGLGVSGSALKGAANFATGLADSTYQNQFNNQQQIYNDYVNQAQLKGNQLNQIYGQISAPVSTGESAASQTGNAGTAAANAQSQLYNATGNALGTGAINSANALNNGLNSVGTSGLNYLAMQNALGSGSGGGGYVDTSSTF